MSDPKKCPDCVGYGRTHEQHCPRYKQQPCSDPECAALRERINVEEMAKHLRTRSMIMSWEDAAQIIRDYLLKEKI